MAHRTLPRITFRRIFLETLSLLIERKKEVCIALLSFALLLAVITTMIDQRIGRISDAVTQKAGMTSEQLLENVHLRLQNLTPDETNVLLRAIVANVTSQTVKTEGNDPAFVFIIGVGPWMTLSVLLHVFVLLAASVFFLLLANRRLDSAYEISRSLPLMIVKMVMLTLCLLIRSFFWIPFFGPLIGLYTIPRLILSPVIYVKGILSIPTSLKESMKRTKGHWLSMIFLLLSLTVLTIAALWFGIVIIIVLAEFSSKLSFIFWLLTAFFISAFQTFFLTRLTESMA